MTQQSVGKQIAFGTFWTVLMRMSISLLGMISVIILARFLLPEDYGLVAKAILVGGFLEMITQFGFAAALIKNQKASIDDYNTVWTISILRAFLIAFILFIGAPHIAVYFDEPKIESLIYCYALANFIAGFNNVGVIDFQKKMDFKKDFKYNLIKRLSSFLTTIVIAIIYKSYWAFPIGVLVGNIAALVASYGMSTYRPFYSLSAFRVIFHFSKWMFLYETLSAVSTKIDGFLLSKFGTSEEFGLYTVANEVAGIPSTEIAMPVARAALPGLSKLNHDPVNFQKMYVSILATVLLLAIPAATGLSILANDITLVVLGDNWIMAGPIISILAFFGITRVLTACAVSGLIAFDRVDILSKFTVIMVVLKIIILPMAVISFGYIGLAYAVLLVGLIGVLIILIMQKFIGLLLLGLLFSQIWRVVCANCIMVIGLIFLTPIINFLGELPILFVLLIKVIIGVLLFSLSLAMFCFFSDFENSPEEKIFNILKSKLQR